MTIDEFRKIELKVATIKKVELHSNADKLYVVEIDLGNETRQIVAGIRPHYTPEQLVGRQVVIVTNLEPATIRGVQSNGMLLAASDDQGMTILTLDRPIAPGAIVK
jgi:methionyl-tRNA synthetase